MKDSAYSTDSQTTGAPKQRKMRRTWRLPISVWVSVCILALVPVARLFLFETDHQLANLAGIGISMLGCLVAYVGCWRHFAKTAIRKFLFLATPLSAVAIGLSFFEFVGFTGETLPVFRMRSWLNRSFNDRTANAQSDGSLTHSSGIQESNALPFSSLQFLGSDRNGVIRNEEFSVVNSCEFSYGKFFFAARLIR